MTKAKTKNSAQESFYELIMKMATSESDRKRALPRLGSVFQEIFLEYEHIEYPAIYKMVSVSSLDRVDIETILEILVEVEKQISKAQLKVMIQKMRRNFLLSYEQKVSFDRIGQEFRANLKKSEDNLITVQSQLSDVQEELIDAYNVLNAIDNDSSKIYAQFITILGIFTAIVVSVFGGLSIVSGVFDKINETPMWKIVLTGSMVSLFVLCLMFLLTRWISTIVRKSFGHETERSLMQVLTNNGAFAIGLFIFSYLIIASVIFSSNESILKLKGLIIIGDSIPILIILSLPILVGIFITFKIFKVRNDN